MKGSWPQVRLGDLMKRSTATVAIQPDADYREVTVKLWGKGVVLRGVASGATIAGGRRFVTKTGQLILSRIDARNGAIGIVPAELDGAVVTNDFPIFDLDPLRLDSSFIRWLCKTPGFVELCKRASEGTTNRVRLQEERFLALEIRLPALGEQRRIVARIDQLAAMIAEARLLREQGFGEVKALHKSAVSSALDSMRSQMRTVDQIVGRDALRNGKSVKPTGEDGVFRCLTLSSMRRGRIDLTQSKPVPLTAEDARQFTVRRRDVFVVRGNGSKHLCGQAGLVENESENVVFPDLFIRVPLPESIMLPEFFVAVWNSGPVRAEIEDKAKTTSGIWKVNQAHISSTCVPVPSLSEQHRIVAYLDRLDKKADSLKRLQGETAAELDALLPAILDRAFKGEL